MLFKIKSLLSTLFSKKKTGIPETGTSKLDEFFAITIGDIMIPRSDIVAVSSQASFQEVMGTFLKTGFRWLPVYRDTLDHIIGVVSVHCILSLRESLTSEDRWYRHLNHASFAPASMTTQEALRRLQHHHKAAIIFIVDEHGGVEGMLTKGHLLRELSALYLDDFSEEEEMVISREPVLVLNGRMDLETFEEECGATNLFDKDEESRVNTIGGWLCAFVGRVPLKGEVISHPAGFSFEIRQADPRRIHEIAVLKTAPIAAPPMIENKRMHE